MAMNRIQFQRGLSLDEFLEAYGDQAKCEAILEKDQWPYGFICPKCSNKSHCVVWHGKVKTFQCNNCHAQTTLTTGTIFHSSKLSLTKWFQAMFLMTQTKNSISALELKRLIGVSYPTSWLVKQKIMETMCEREKTTVLSGRIEADDAYLGGENPDGKAGRGSENKIPFVAAVQTNDKGNPVYAIFSPVKAFNIEEIEKWTKERIAPLSEVVTDGLACFNAVTLAGCIHHKEVVGKKRKSTDMECFNWVNTILGNLKTSFAGTYHAFNYKKYGYRYLAEIQYRFNRRFDLSTILPRLIKAAARIGKRTESWLRMAEDSF